MRTRRSELEQDALTRIYAISASAATSDPAYLTGLQAAVAAALDYAFAALASPSGDLEPVPVPLLAQARLAARNGVSLDAVLRRYAAGQTLIVDALLDEAATAGLGAAELKSTMRALANRYDRVIAAVSEEHRRESKVMPRSSGRRHALLRRLLAGEPLDASELEYDFEAHHLAIVASGPDLAKVLTELGRRIDRRALLTTPDERSTWAWLGGRRPFGEEALDLLASTHWPRGGAVACGEAGEGLAGWRLSHRQAVAALPVAQRSSPRFVRYADITLLAAALCDDLLATSLRRRYLAPLESGRNGGAAVKETLRAYFAAARNVSSAAAALGVSRTTVHSRLLAVERRLACSLEDADPELQVALRLDAIERRSREHLREEFA